MPDHGVPVNPCRRSTGVEAPPAQEAGRGLLAGTDDQGRRSDHAPGFLPGNAVAPERRVLEEPGVAGHAPRENDRMAGVMPRSLLVAIVAVSFLGLLSLAVVPVGVPGLAGRTGLDLVSQAVWVIPTVIWPIVAIFTVRGLVRRSARTRQMAFAVSLVTSLILAFIALMVTVILLAPTRPGRVDFVETMSMMLLVGAPFVAIAWSLSRPSAKAWFSSSPPRP